MVRRARGGIVVVVVCVLILAVGVTAGLAVRNAGAPGSPPASRVATATGAGTQASDKLPDGNDWTQFRSDVYGTGRNAEQSITSANVARLSERWAVRSRNGFYTTPAIVNGVVYVTTGLSLSAYDLRSGVLLWRFDAQPERKGGIHSSVAVDPARGLAFFGTPEAFFYAVDIRTGAQKWRTRLGDPANGAYIWSSPLVVNGNVYIGLASENDDPCVRGEIFAFEETTGKPVWTHYTLPAGAIGAGVWSSLTAIPEARAIIATTGNPCSSPNVVAE